MRKWLAALMSMVLLLSLCSCGIGDVTYYRGMWYLLQGEYTAAYECLRVSTVPAAAETLEKLVFVPLTYTYKSPDTQRDVTLTYNEAGYLTKVDTVYANSSRSETYVYEGNVLKEYVCTEVYNGITDTSRRTFNEQGKPLYTAYYYGDNLYEELYYVYDAKGNLLKHTDSGESFSNWEEYTYDEEGRTLTENSEYQGVTHTSTFTYAEDGSYVKNTQNDSGDEQWRTQTHYDPQGRVVRTRTTYAGDTAYDADLAEYSYDAAGNEIYRYRKWGDNVESSTAEYNEHNQLVYRKTLDEDGQTIALIRKTYNAAGQILTAGYSDNGIIWRKETYTYDEEGKLLNEHLTDPDLLVNREITYTYNANGTLKFAEQQGSSGWMRTAYGYDEWGNRIQSLTQWERNELSATATWQLHYYPDGVPEDITDFIEGMEWDR